MKVNLVVHSSSLQSEKVEDEQVLDGNDTE